MLAFGGSGGDVGGSQGGQCGFACPGNDSAFLGGNVQGFLQQLGCGGQENGQRGECGNPDKEPGVLLDEIVVLSRTKQEHGVEGGEGSKTHGQGETLEDVGNQCRVLLYFVKGHTGK